VADEWLTLEQAAERLGVSVHAVRRRLKKGELAARQVSTRYGPAWEVSLNGAVTLAEDSRESDAGVAQALRDPDATVTTDLVALVERQQRQIVENASAAAMWQARAEMLAGELADARGQLLALQAPQPEPTPEEPPATVAPVEERPRASWWRRVLFG
jgi:excisionase family DNA binding protein